MQKQRQVHDWTAKQTAQAFGCSQAHISRVEHGKMPSRELVLFYEDTFEADGILLSIYEVAASAPEDARRRAGGRKPRLDRAVLGDVSTFLNDTIPHGTLMEPGETFIKTWRIQNSGSVPWVSRRLARQGPITGPGLITSPPADLLIPDTEPGGIAEISTPLKAPTYDCCSIAYFKMVDAAGQICFPDNYQLGLDVIVLVRGQLPDIPSQLDIGPAETAEEISARS